MPETDEDILRGLMRRCTDDVHAPASIPAQVVTRQRRRARRGRVLSLTATTAAQHALYRLSSLAAAAPQSRGRYVVMREIQDNYKRRS
jgi:hypothetical protein